MAYKGSNLSLMADSIEGTVSFFAYVTTDAVATVSGSGYFVDGGMRGMEVGDLVFLISSGVGYLCYVSNVSASLAVTITATALGLANGNSLPTSNPGPGSGLFWNNNGFMCIA